MTVDEDGFLERFGDDSQDARDLTFMHATDQMGFQLGQTLLRVHAGWQCAGPPGANGKPVCCIHNPSDHHMATWPMNWRSDTSVMERICPHGVGHPDPDHLSYVRYRAPMLADGQGIHGCDRCCAPPETDQYQIAVLKEPEPKHPQHPVMGADALGAAIGVSGKTVKRYLMESRRENGRYADHPFPEPFDHLGREPYWTRSQLPEIQAWLQGRAGRGAGGGRKKQDDDSQRAT